MRRLSLESIDIPLESYLPFVSWIRFTPVAWWFTRSRIGRDLREQYKVPTELPSELRALIRKLDEIEGYELFREFQRTDSRNKLTPRSVRRTLY